MLTGEEKSKTDNQGEGSSSQTVDMTNEAKGKPRNARHVQLSTSVWIFFDEKLSDHADIFVGEQLHGHFASLPIVVKLVEKNECNKREARILSKLCYHSNVISLVETGFYEGSFGNYIYIAMDKCHNENLRDFVESRKETTFDQKCDILKQIISGMEFIHARNIAHLDLKPDNIFFTLDQETIKIADFGLSEELDEKKKFVKYQFGTDGFRPPESFGKSFISLKSDIFSLGIVFYFVLSNGKNPFGEDLDDQNSNVKKGLIDLSCLLVPNPRTTEHLLKCMLEMKSSNRPTISQVSMHPCWTGNEVECDYDYKTCETPPDFNSCNKDEELYCNLEDLSTLQALLERHSMKDSEAQIPGRVRETSARIGGDFLTLKWKPPIGIQPKSYQVELCTKDGRTLYSLRTRHEQCRIELRDISYFHRIRVAAMNKSWIGEWSNYITLQIHQRHVVDVEKTFTIPDALRD